MTHPFFDVVQFPWHHAASAPFHTVLSQAVANPQQIDLLYQRVQANLLPLNLNQAPDLVWKEALEKLARQGALRTFCEQAATTNVFQNAVVQAALLAVFNATPPVSETVTAKLIISERVLLLDRLPLRKHLESMMADDDPMKILLVRGEPNSGKSRSQLLFERVAVSQGATPVYLSADTAPTLDELITQLFATLQSSDKIPDRLTTDDAWYRQVCLRLQEIASTKQLQLWIALDDLGMDQNGDWLLVSEIRDFCNQLALSMTNPAFRRWFRLMFIHYPDGPVPTKWRSEFWGEDRTTSADIQQDHIAEAVRTWCKAKNRIAVEDEVIALTKSIISTAEASLPDGVETPPRLLRIHEAFLEAMQNPEAPA